MAFLMTDCLLQVNEIDGIIGDWQEGQDQAILQVQGNS